MALDCTQGEGRGFAADVTPRLRAAAEGDAASLAWVVSRFSPALLSQARFRLARVGRRLSPVLTSEDLVNEVWAIALPRLRNREHPFATESLLRFLATTLINLLNNAMRKEFRRKSVACQGDMAGEGSLARLPDETTGVISRAVREEQKGQVLAALERLPELDRRIVILRGVEQSTLRVVATLLGMKPNTVSQRYRRALAKLQRELPTSVFADVAAGGG